MFLPLILLRSRKLGSPGGANFVSAVTRLTSVPLSWPSRREATKHSISEFMKELEIGSSLWVSKGVGTAWPLHGSKPDKELVVTLELAEMAEKAI